MRLLAFLGAALGILALTGIEAQAVPFATYGFSGSSGVFSASCSGPADGGLPNGNIPDNRVFFKAGSDCTVDPLTSSANSSFASGSVSASGTTTSALGSISGAATMSTGVQSSVLFPAGFTDSGWIDTMLIQSQGNEGMVAQASILLNVGATLNVSGPNVFARLQFAVSSELGGVALHQPSFFIQAPASPLVVNQTLVLDLPFIIGTESQFLVRAMAQAMTSSATSFGNNTSNVGFLNTITWGGIDKVTVGGIEVAEFTAIGVDSGIDWAVAIPEPSTALLLGSGLAGLVLVRRRRRA